MENLDKEYTQRFKPAFRFFAAFVCFCFVQEIVVADIARLQSGTAFAQVTMPTLNLVMPSASFLPPALKAIHIDPQLPLEIDFIIDGADQSQVKKSEINLLVQYFLAVLTTPEKDLWVNLSPYESTRIITPQLGETAAGRDLLSQDNLLKQLAASLTYPESKIGKAFWDRVYQKAQAAYGTTAVPIDTFQRVWIMPEKAVVYEYNGTAFIAESRLKVLLEDDYLALKNAQADGNQPHLSPSEAQKVNNFSSAITREVILPEIEKEINEGRNFASLRQIFHALILATWFKKKLRQHVLSRAYVDRKKVKGIEDATDETAEKIYQNYLQVLKDGVYNYVREDFDGASQTIVPRQYFSGGFSVGDSSQWLSIRPISTVAISSGEFLKHLGWGPKSLFAKIRLRPLGIGSIPETKNKNFRSWALGGLLAASMLAISPMVTAAVSSEETVSAKAVVVQQTTLKRGDAISLSDQMHMTALKNSMTIEDVLALKGKANLHTGKTYKIDGNYFKRNWDQIFTSPTYGWAQQAVVLAFQNKMGLIEDGQLGRMTRKAIAQQTVDKAKIVAVSKMPIVGAGGPSGSPPPEVAFHKGTVGSLSTPSAVTHGPAVSLPVAAVQHVDNFKNNPKEAKSWINTIVAQFNYYNNLIFEMLLTMLVGLQTFRIYRDSKHSLSDRVELLRILTRYLQGADQHSFSNYPGQLISKQTSLADMTARAVGNQIEIIIRSSNSLQGRREKKRNKQTQQAIQNAVSAGDFRLMSGINILEFKHLERFDTRIHMFFEMPPGEKVNGKGVTVYYRGSGKDHSLKSFQMSVSEDAFKELEDEWEEVLKKDVVFSETVVEDLVSSIRIYRQKNPPTFKDFRNQAVVAFKMRKLAVATLRKIKKQNISSAYTDYFYHLGQYANMLRYLLAQSATLDTYKSNFLPESDKLNFKKFLGFSIDKPYRVVTLVEYAYSRAQNNVRSRLAEYYNHRKVLDQMEIQMKSTSDGDGEQVALANKNKQDYTVGSLRSEFDQFSMSFEKPYANSIVGLDLFRRHGKVLKSIKDLLFLFSPFILWWSLGSSFSLWVPFALGVMVFITVNYFAPNLNRFFTFYEYLKFSGIFVDFKPTHVPENFASPILSKDTLLNYVTAQFLPKTWWSHSKFVLAATRFSDVKAIRENSYIEVRFIADSHFMTSNGNGDDVVAQVNRAISEGRLSFRLALKDGVDEINPDRITVYVHPTGIRLRIKNVDSHAENIDFLYNGKDIDHQKSYILAITNDPFKQLINQWDHFMHDAKKDDFSGLDALIVAIKEFYKPGNMNLTDFRKNAGFYHLIREHAFTTYETLVVNGGRKVDPRYRQYFLELARYSTEVRFLSASFAGMDALKVWYLPDGDLFRRKIFGFPISRILRAIFGVSFLYSWARTDTLKSIQRVTAQWGKLDFIQAQIPLHTTSGLDAAQAIEKKLKAEFEKADFNFRYPAKNSLVGNDKYSRSYGMWIMSGFFVTLLFTIAIMALPLFIVNSSMIAFLNQPQFFGLSLVNFSVVFYVIAYWINPIHGNNAMEQERNSYLKIIESYEKNSSHGEMLILQSRRMLDSIWTQAFYYLSYILGIFFPTVIIGYFLYQQVQSKFWKNGNGNGNGNGYSHQSTIAGGPPDSVAVGGPPDPKTVASSAVSNNIGGIDLQFKNNIEIRGQNQPSWGAFLAPEIFMQNIEGMDFQILELTPIINPPLFIPDFVKGNAPIQQLLSFKTL